MSKIEVKIEKLKNSEIEIKGSVPFENLQKHREKAVKSISENISVDGFRKGHVPEKIVIEQVGEMSILNEMAELALQDAYPTIIMENKLDIIGSPQVSITKIAEGNPMEFTIKTVVMPEIKLADYKKIAKKVNSAKEEKIEVTEEEVENTVKQIQTGQAQQSHTCEGDSCSHDKDQKEELPEVNDEFVKKLGDFKDVADFKAKLKDDIKTQKEKQEVEKKRMNTIEEIAKETKIDLPEILIETELRKMTAEMQDNIARMGLQFDKYLEHIKKTEEDLKKEWRPDAEKRVKIQMVLGKIAGEEKVVPNEDEVKKNVETLMAQYKDANKDNVEIYVKMLISNEEVFKFLEAQK